MANPFAQFVQPEPNPFAQFITAASPPPPPPGMRAVQPGEIPTASGYYPVAEPDVPRTFTQRALGYVAAPLDIALTLGSAAARGLAAPVYGLVTGRGEAGAKEVMEGVRQPQTPEAQAALQAVAPALQALPPVIGTGALPQLAVTPATQTVGSVARTTAADVRGAGASREAQRSRVLIERSRQLGPKIDAAAQGREVGLAAPPQEIDVSRGVQMRARVAGEKTIAYEINRANAPKWNENARIDLGLPPGTQLNQQTLIQSRQRPDISGPYEEVSNLGRLNTEGLDADLNAVRPGAIYGASKETAAVNDWVTNLAQELSQGADSRAVVRSIRQMREEANNIFKLQRAGQRVEPVDTALANAKLGAANALEELIARNVQDRTVLYRFQDARGKLAQTYDYERALNFATGEIDPKELAKLAAEGRPLSGNLAKMANFAANFPEVSTLAGPGLRPSVLSRVGRGTVGGMVGTTAGLALGGVNPLAYAGGLALGSILGERAATLTARGMASPAAQAALANVPDYRLPINRLTPAEISTNRLLPTPYDWSRATAPDWVPGGGRVEPTFGVELPPNVPQLGLSTAEETMANVRRMREGEYTSDLLRAQEAERAAQQAAQSPYGQMVSQLAAGRPERTSRGEILFDLDPITGRLREVSQGIKGATPDVLESTGKSLDSAVRKLSGEMAFETRSQFQRVQVGVDAQGAPIFEVRQVPLELSPAEAKKYALPTRESQAFALTADEKIAWDKAKASLAEVAPGFKALDDKAIVNKMMNRQWVEDTVKKAREKAAAFEEIAARATDAQARRDAMAKRDQLLDTLDALEERLRTPRPVELGGQGPKTRAAKAEATGRVNMLAPEPSPVANELIVPQSVGGGPRPRAGPVEVTAGPSIASRRPPEPPAPPPPSPPPPAAPPTPPTPRAPAVPAASGELVDSYARVHKGYKPTQAQLNDPEWLGRQLSDAMQMRVAYARSSVKPPEGMLDNLADLTTALDERIAALQQKGAKSSGQEALDAALKRTFGYTATQVKRHFSSRDQIERGIFQVQQQINLDKQLTPAQRAGSPQGLEELLAALQARLKEMK